MKTKLLGFILLLTLLPGCAGRIVSIEGAAQGVKATSLGLAVLEDITIDLHSSNVLSRSTAEAIMDFSFHANIVGLEASKFIRTLSEVTPDDRQRLEKIVAPLLDSLDTLMAEKIIHIKNPGTRERIETALFLVRLSIMNLGDL